MGSMEWCLGFKASGLSFRVWCQRRWAEGGVMDSILKEAK